ncbi:MAG: DUF4351 domain-containing protein [Aphanocapsa sp. GSE-SYN-MK-11-07L]|jgi:hypothetical protein|nr:DUF4351 domain-containing protein [Aphanocapsa sp. GSE-SYN-MK-11-07L]
MSFDNTYKFLAIAPETEAQIRPLSLAQLKKLGEALLDFSALPDLSDWLRSHS